MNAQDLMTEDPISLPVTAKVREALAILRTMDIRHVPVVGHKDELIGMLSDRDLRSARASDLDAPVTELMSADVVSVGPESDALEVIDLMIDTKVGAVPVVDDEDGSLLGIISYVDVLRKLRAKLADQDE
jgi:acetoin utilization protein AcuB